MGRMHMTRRSVAPVFLAAVVCIAAWASPAYAQAEKGDKDAQVFGTLIIPHSSPGSASAFGDFGMGYYVTKTDRFGFDISGSGGGGTGGFTVTGGYDYFITPKNPKLFPFLGIQLGATTQFAGGSSNTLFESQLEFGVDYYVAKKVALDSRYMFQ